MFLALFYFGLPILTLAFIARVIASTFSGRVYGQIQRHPILHWIWPLFALAGFLVFVSPSFWPLAFVERWGQRAKVRERVERVGGWAAVRAGCRALVSTNPEGSYWNRSMAALRLDTNKAPRLDTNEMAGLIGNPPPMAVAALEPMDLRIERTQTPEGRAVAVVQIGIFGMHSTCGHSTPHYGLVVPYGVGAASYWPAGSGPRRSTHRKIIDEVFEMYY